VSARETAIAALAARLDAALAVPVLRDEPWPERVPASGLVIVRDGRLLTATTMISPLAYIHEHEAEVEVIVPAGARARTMLDGLLVALGAALAAHRTLSGAVDYLEVGAPDLDAFDIGEAGAVRAARVPVTLTFTTEDTPLA
jgi:hypothetical protein